MSTQRGACVGNNWTNQQLKAIELFATGHYKCSEVAKMAGVCNETISKWRSNYQFIEAIIKRSREELKAALPDLYQIGLKEAKNGSSAHLRILLEHIEKLEELGKKTPGRITFTWTEDEDSTEL
jgi:cob(I)alamin adenosyltransferase